MYILQPYLVFSSLKEKNNSVVSLTFENMKQSFDNVVTAANHDSESEISTSEDEEKSRLCEENVHVSYKSIASTGSSPGQGSITSSIFTLVSTMIGGGLLSLPFAFQQGGLVVASISLVFVLIGSTYGGFLIINSKKYCHGKIKNIEDVAEVAFGNSGKVRSSFALFTHFYIPEHIFIYLKVTL